MNTVAVESSTSCGGIRRCKGGNRNAHHRHIQLQGRGRKDHHAVNLAAIYAKRGLRTLLIDLDPQASATDFFGLYEPAAREHRSAVELLYGNAPVEDVAFEAETENLYVVPSTIDLVDQNELLLREQRLRFALDDCDDAYDVCIVDCSPTMKRLAFNAYLAAAGNGWLSCR